MDKEKIIQYALGNITNTLEKEKLATKIREDKASKEFYVSIKNAHALTKEPLKDVDLEADYRRLQLNIKTSKTRVLKSIVRYAAVFILLVSISIPLYKYLSPNNELAELIEVSCPAGQIKKIELSDGTHVWLNGKSKLIYPSEYEKISRNVELIGEAFFDVVHDESRPFVVKTYGLNVRVLGTSFNVEAFPGSNIINTTLIKGKVVLEKKLADKTISLAELEPNDHVSYHIADDKIIQSKLADVSPFIAWKDGDLVFLNDPIETVAKRLGQKYNVTVKIKSEGLKKLRFTGTFTNETIDEVLSLLKISSPIEYEIVNNVQLGDSLHARVIYIKSNYNSDK